jgi:hypothetical protein
MSDECVSCDWSVGDAIASRESRVREGVSRVSRVYVQHVEFSVPEGDQINSIGGTTPKTTTCTLHRAFTATKTLHHGLRRTRSYASATTIHPISIHGCLLSHV